MHVTVADRFGTIGYQEGAASLDRVLAELESFELSCPECGPQAWGAPALERPLETFVKEFKMGRR